MEQLTIVGAGCAGLTAAIYASRANLNPLVLTGMLPGGQLTQTTEVENYPGFPEGIFGFDLMEALKKQAERFGSRIRGEQVVSAQLAPGGPHKLTLGNGEIVETRALIVATGASPRYLDLPSEQALRNKGVSYCATCDGAFFRDVPIAVIGGGDSAVEEALFLARFGSKVILVHRRDELRASKIMQKRAFANQKLEFCWNSTVQEILGVEKGSVTGIRVLNKVSGQSTDIDCGAVFVAIGHVPNTAAYQGQLDMDDNGFLKVDDPHTSTNIEGVFAAGDCSDHVYQQAVTAAGMGCRAAIDAERWLGQQEG